VQKERKYKILILITDGEDHEGEVLRQARLAYQEGIKIFTVGIGKTTGVPIPNLQNGSKKGYKKTRDGEVVVSQVDEDLLKNIAAATGGRYYHVVSGDWGITGIYESVNDLEKKELTNKMVTVYDDKYQFILIFAFLFLIAELLIPERVKP